MMDGHFLIFTEHQSTLNENMPLRLLFYVIQEYEKLIGYRIVKGKQVSNPLLYKRELIPIPKPEFFVLYNGEDDLKDEEMEKQAIREEERARTTIDMALDFGYSNEEILSTLQKKLGVTEQQADEYLRKFYDKTL